jgi:hypothetical protein
VTETPVKPQHSSRPEEEHQVLPFRPRNTATSATPQRGHRPAGKPAEVEDLAKYETEEEPDDYRHRMLVNLAALVVTIALSIAGAWLAWQIADMRKKQDCALSGRSNCVRIESTSSYRP